MPKFSFKDSWMFIAGAALLIWGVTSAFSDQRLINDLIQSSQDGHYVTATTNPPRPFVAPPLTNGTPGQGENRLTPSVTLPVGGTPGAPSPSSGEDVFIPQIPAPTAQPTQGGPPLIPDRIVIPAIKLDAPINPVAERYLQLDNVSGVFEQWTVPDKYAAGWIPVTATLGVTGNMVLDGHHNVWGEVFGHLIDLNAGDYIYVYSGTVSREYVIRNKMILPERNEPIDIRLQNARWLLPTQDERITLVTCWPHWTNTHRLIIVASPVGWVNPAQ